MVDGWMDGREEGWSSMVMVLSLNNGARSGRAVFALGPKIEGWKDRRIEGLYILMVPTSTRR